MNVTNANSKPNPPKDVPASMAINGWDFPTASKKTSQHTRYFVKVNRMALQRGYVTAKEVNDFVKLIQSKTIDQENKSNHQQKNYKKK